jgi:hypothetical protein
MLCGYSCLVFYTFETEYGDEVADPSMVKSEDHPLPENFEIEVEMFRPCFVKDRGIE